MVSERWVWKASRAPTSIRARMTDTRSLSNIGVKLMPVNVASPGLVAPGGAGEARGWRGCTTTTMPRPLAADEAASSDQTALPISPEPPSIDTTTAAPCGTLLSVSALVRYTRTWASSTIGR